MGVTVDSLFRGITERFTNDIAIDLGTSSTLIYVKGKGIELREPSIVTIDELTHEVVAVGTEAKRMLGRTPEGIRVIRPMKDGVIADFGIVEIMLKTYIGMVQRKKLFVRPRIIVCVPSCITEVEKRAVRDSVEASGAREIYLVSEPIAAAIGVGLPVEAPTGNMIIDIGGGTTEIAVVALSGVVNAASVRVAGDEMDDAIVNYIKKNYNLIIGEQTSESVKIAIGSAYTTGKEETMEVKGRDLVAGLPKTLTLTTEEVREALHEPISTIVEAIRFTLERSPPELSADLVDRGLVLAGGGALLHGMDKLIAEQTGLPVHIADDPLSAVAEGTGMVLHELKFLRKVASTPF